MAFDAGRVVEKLDYGGFPSPLDHIRGTVPEPTDDELQSMNAKMRDAFKAVIGDVEFDPTDQQAVAALFSKATDEDLRKMQEMQLDALQIVCKQSPSREQLVEMGPRNRRYFTEWLMGCLNGQGK